MHRRVLLCFMLWVETRLRINVWKLPFDWKYVTAMYSLIKNWITFMITHAKENGTNAAVLSVIFIVQQNITSQVKMDLILLLHKRWWSTVTFLQQSTQRPCADVAAKKIEEVFFYKKQKVTFIKINSHGNFTAYRN